MCLLLKQPGGGTWRSGWSGGRQRADRPLWRSCVNVKQEERRPCSPSGPHSKVKVSHSLSLQIALEYLSKM